MELFNAHERAEFEEVIREIQELEDFSAFEDFVLEKLPRFLGGSFASWNEYDGMMNLTRVATSKSHEFAVSEVFDKLRATIASHPLFGKYIDPITGKARYVDTVDRTRAAISDEDFRRLPFYRQVASILGIEDQLVMHVYIKDARGIVLTFHSSQIFKDRQHLRASIIRGHLVARLYSIDRSNTQRQTLKSEMRDHLEKRITRRESNVLELVCEGMSNQEIADLLQISKRTSDHHVSSLLKKLHASNRSQLISRFGSWLGTT